MNFLGNMLNSTIFFFKYEYYSYKSDFFSLSRGTEMCTDIEGSGSGAGLIKNYVTKV